MNKIEIDQENPMNWQNQVMGKIKFWNIMSAACKKLWNNDLHNNKIYI
jgi:hypothetical protein